MTLFSELGHSLLWMALLSWAGSRGGASARGGWVGALLAAGLSLLPGEWSPGFYTRALLGDLSALSWAYLLHLLLFSLRGRRLISRREGRAMAWPALLGAILIYPSSLGAPGIPDLYSNDGGSYVLPSVALALALLYLWRGFLVASLTIVWALLLYGFRLHESANLWDCLFDFLAVVVSVAILLRWRRGAHPGLQSEAEQVSLDPS